MAFRSFRFLTRFAKPHNPFPSTRRSPLSSLHAPPPHHDQPNLDDRLVLDQLSHLFPTLTSKSQNPVFPNPHPNAANAVDAFLPPEDKLRGVFLQKLKGRAAIESAFYHVIVKALGRRKFFDFMMDALCDMRRNAIDGDLFMLSVVVDSFVRAGHVSRAIQVFGNLDDLGVRRDTEALNVLLLCLCRRSHVGAANSVLNSMKGKVDFDVGTYNAVAGGWSRFGRVSEVERVMREMEADGLRPDCRTFGFLIEGLGREGRMDEAVEILCGMKEMNCQPDTETYNAVIFNFVSVGDFEECIKYYNRMLSDNCEPNLDTYARMINRFLRARKVADALLMFDEMLRRGVVPSTGTITTFIKRLCSYGPPYAALMIYKKARKLGCVISMEAYKILLMRLSMVGKCGTLLSIWEEMQECGYSSDLEVYECIISGLCNVGQLENAVLVMEEALRKGFCPSRLVYSKLSNRLLASDKSERAYKLFLKIKCPFP
uniref:Pentacotripeptide-repeat region of PRORP domain-containing protein n=1 Tax=Glycine max TaxID=3847 RepID=A0A368UGZ9_SOYBN